MKSNTKTVPQSGLALCLCLCSLVSFSFCSIYFKLVNHKRGLFQVWALTFKKNYKLYNASIVLFFLDLFLSSHWQSSAKVIQISYFPIKEARVGLAITNVEQECWWVKFVFVFFFLFHYWGLNHCVLQSIPCYILPPSIYFF